MNMSTQAGRIEVTQSLDTIERSTLLRLLDTLAEWEEMRETDHTLDPPELSAIAGGFDDDTEWVGKWLNALQIEGGAIKSDEDGWRLTTVGHIFREALTAGAL
jgi:hypothetical protein